MKGEGKIERDEKTVEKTQKKKRDEK